MNESFKFTPQFAGEKKKFKDGEFLVVCHSKWLVSVCGIIFLRERMRSCDSDLAFLLFLFFSLSYLSHFKEVPAIVRVSDVSTRAGTFQNEGKLHVIWRNVCKLDWFGDQGAAVRSGRGWNKSSNQRGARDSIIYNQITGKQRTFCPLPVWEFQVKVRTRSAWQRAWKGKWKEHSGSPALFWYACVEGDLQ